MKRKTSFLIIFFCTFVLLAQDQLSNLPTFYIRTVGLAPIVSKSEYLPAKLTIISADPTEIFADSTGIRGRGNSTWGMAKKPYKLKLYEKNTLLNRPANETKWTLLANYADKTLIRHAVAFKISEFIGFEFTPTARFVDLVLNNQYQGSYLMSDQMEVATGRVEVEKQKEGDKTEPNITGGYLMEVDGFAAGEPKHFYTNRQMPITVKYPKDDKINDEQFNYIRNYVQAFEQALFSNEFTDPTLGYRAYIDENSLINWYIASEFTGNSDAFWSTYIYKKRNNPKLYFGPMWDYDIAFNNDNRLGDATEKMMREHGHSHRTWIVRIWEDPWFRKAVNTRWKELVAMGIEQSVVEYIDELELLIEQSQQLNFEKWPVLNQVVYREVYVFPSFKEGIDYLKSYIYDRAAFLNKGFESNGEPELFPPFEPTATAYYHIINKRSGNVIDFDDKFGGEELNLMHWEAIDNKESQQWKFVETHNGLYHIINRANGKAIEAIGNLGANIVASDLDNTASFAWQVINTNVEDYYAIFNQASGFCFNNSGGSDQNGNPLIEWNSNINTSENAKYAIVKVAENNTSIDRIASSDIKLWVDVSSQTLRVLPATGLPTQVNLSIYSINGVASLTLTSYQLGSMVDISNVTKGVYLLQLQTEAGVYSSKFIK